jgi:hypothetical protein
MDGGGAGRVEVGEGVGRVVVVEGKLEDGGKCGSRRREDSKGSGQARRCCCLTGSGLAAEEQGFSGNERTPRLSRGKGGHSLVGGRGRREEDDKMGNEYMGMECEVGDYRHVFKKVLYVTLMSSQQDIYILRPDCDLTLHLQFSPSGKSFGVGVLCAYIITIPCNVSGLAYPSGVLT